MRAASVSLLLLACTSATHTPPAPPPPDAAGRPGDRFLPAGYHGEIVTDWAALRANGLLATIERMPMMTDFVDGLAAGYGCDLDALRHVRTAIVFDPEDTGRSMRTVSVAAVDAAPELPAVGDGWQPYAAGGIVGRRFDGGSHARITVCPQPGLVVEGEHELLDPLLRGTRPAGGAHPELAAFAAGEGVLAQYAAGTFGRPAHAVSATVGFPGHHDAGDPCEFVRLRVAEDGSGAIEVSLSLRYRPDSANLRRTETDLRNWLDRGIAAPELAALAPMLREIVIAHDQRDLHVRWDLGPPATAVRKLERAVLAMAGARNLAPRPAAGRR